MTERRQLADEPMTIYDCLRKRHEGNEWVLVEEVAPSTGGGTRYADAIAINLWNSRGHEIVGYEVKVSRSDWLRELKRPEKAEPLFRYCDRWFIVATKGIVKPEELPAAWGLLEHSGSRLLAAAPAPRREDATPVTRAFFASLVRRAFEQLDARAGRLVYQQQRDLEKAHERRVEERIAESTRKHKELAAAVAKVSEETGVDFVTWHPPVEVIRLAKALEARGYGNGPLELARELLTRLERASDELRKGLAGFA